MTTACTVCHIFRQITVYIVRILPSGRRSVHRLLQQHAEHFLSVCPSVFGLIYRTEPSPIKTVVGTSSLNTNADWIAIYGVGGGGKPSNQFRWMSITWCFVTRYHAMHTVWLATVAHGKWTSSLLRKSEGRVAVWNYEKINAYIIVFRRLPDIARSVSTQTNRIHTFRHRNAYVNACAHTSLKISLNYWPWQYPFI